MRLCTLQLAEAVRILPYSFRRSSRRGPRRDDRCCLGRCDRHPTASQGDLNKTFPASGSSYRRIGREPQLEYTNEGQDRAIAFAHRAKCSWLSARGTQGMVPFWAAAYGITLHRTPFASPRSDL